MYSLESSCLLKFFVSLSYVVLSFYFLFGFVFFVFVWFLFCFCFFFLFLSLFNSAMNKLDLVLWC